MTRSLDQRLYLWLNGWGGRPLRLARLWYKIDRWHRLAADRVLVTRDATAAERRMYRWTRWFWGVTKP